MSEILCEAAVTCKASEYLAEIARLQAEIAEKDREIEAWKKAAEERFSSELEKSQKIAQLEKSLAEARGLLDESREFIGDYVDGAPDASLASKLANSLYGDIDCFLTRPPASSESGERAADGKCAKCGGYDFPTWFAQLKDPRCKCDQPAPEKPAAREPWVDSIRGFLDMVLEKTRTDYINETERPEFNAVMQWLYLEASRMKNLLPPTDPAKGCERARD